MMMMNIEDKKIIILYMLNKMENEDKLDWLIGELTAAQAIGAEVKIKWLVNELQL